MVLNSVAPWLLLKVFFWGVDVFLIYSRSLQVSVFGGYTDERGDAARNSMSLLEALHDQERTLEVGRVKRFQFISHHNHSSSLSLVIIITRQHFHHSPVIFYSWLSFAWVHITQGRTRREKMKQF